MGTVEAPAPDSREFKRGDRVSVLPLIPCGACPPCGEKEFFHCTSYNFLGSRTDGGFAEFCLVPTANLFRLPPTRDERIGAFLEPICVALHVVKRSEFQPQGRALIFGAGAIGLLTAMWLRVFRAREVVIADIRPESLAIAQKAGFAHIIDPSTSEFNNLRDFDYVFEAAGANPALLAAIEKVRRKGIITIVGRDTRDTTIPLKMFEKLMRKEICLKGCWGYNNTGCTEIIQDAIQNNAFNIAPLVTKEIYLHTGEKVIPQMFNREIFFCKILFKI